MSLYNEYICKKVLITGGSGLIGQVLSNKLFLLGYKVKHLSSKKFDSIKNFDTYFWNIENNFLPKEALEDIDIIIYLSGTSIHKNRWTKKQKNKILSTRIKGIQLILKKIKDYCIVPKVFICANGAFFSKNNNSFLFYLSKLIDENIENFKKIGIRTICFHNGIVLSKNCLFLKKISIFIKFYLGAIFGNGKQYIPWIHIDDLCRMYINAIINFNFNGCYYAISPNQINNSYFISTLAKTLRRPILPFKIPSILFKIIYGEMSDLLIKGDFITINRNIPDFIFNYPFLEDALENIYK